MSIRTDIKKGRFYGMRKEAKKHSKAVPAYSQLEAWAQETGMACPACGVQMCWTTRDGSSRRLVTLQHNRDGSMQLLCRSCNGRHAKYEGDSFYTMDHTKKRCGLCREEKPLEEFYRRRERVNGRVHKCIPCNNEIRRRARAERRTA
jgi:hypothetical protein